jgi:CHASE3 domain sensor protein
MKLSDIKISRQLQVGLGAILVCVALLGGLAWYQADQLWQATEGLYRHPLTVRRALGELTAAVLMMQRGMKDLVLAGNEPERQAVLQSIDTAEADALKQFNVLYDRYLGPRTDIDEVYHAFVAWKSLRAETLRRLQAGETAASRIKPGGPDDLQVQQVLSQIQDISAYS